MKPLPHVYFLRHGETAWSISGQHTGRTDLPLTPHGEQMARDLAPILSSIRFSCVLTSPRLRARRTCELAGLGGAAAVEPLLAEWDYGDYEGLRSGEIRAAHPDWEVWRDGCPGGETSMDVAARADRLIGRLRELGGNVALFSHGQFGRVLALRWVGMPAAEGRHFALDPASISIFGQQPDPPHQPLICMWNAAPALLRHA
jgi:probable phosphoglycerate mutase